MQSSFIPTARAVVRGGFMICLIAFATVDAVAASCKMLPPQQSGAQRLSIAELYTSEGCSSCPPADTWFSTLSLPRDGVVPLAFHVDYWDDIGWKDPFGKPAWAERQRGSVTRQGSRMVYTPQLMLDGKDTRGWTFHAKFAEGLRAIAARPPGATLMLATEKLDADANMLTVNLKVKIADAAQRSESALFVALTENNLQSRVTAGENRGSTLKHNHVVRELIGPITLRSDGEVEFQRRIDVAPGWKRQDMQVAAFVQNLRNGEILQAMSTPICGP